MRRFLHGSFLVLGGALILSPLTIPATSPHAGGPLQLAGLKAAAQVTRDGNDIPHIDATNLHDLYFLQGYLQAQDRLFQMDFSRRQASGTLAELLGPGALPTDVQLRTFGLRRSAEASLPILSVETQQALAAFSDGVNAWVAAHPVLPPEYQALNLATFEPWTPVDSVAVGKLIAFGLSFDLSDIDRTVALLSYQQAGQGLGFDGTKLFFDDLFRSQPFTAASTIPDATGSSSFAAAGWQAEAGFHGRFADRELQRLASRYLAKVSNLPLVRRYIDRENRPHSNEWAIAPQNSASGQAIVANDPHLALDTPPVWYPNHQHAGSLDVIGNSFPGIPFVVLGHNRRIGWGATVNPLDVTDVFAEQVVPDPSSPSGLSIVHEGVMEPIIPIPEVFKANFNGVIQVVSHQDNSDIPEATLIVPRRNNGPIIATDPLDPTRMLSVAFTGFSPTRELDTFRLFDEAQNLKDFQAALPFFDFGSQNFAYADVDGNIGYFTSAEMPLRTDLQSGMVDGLPPYFVRDGTKQSNDWLPLDPANVQPYQAVPYSILPMDEMPHIVNPPEGWFVNCNNDPIGTTLDNDPLNQLRVGGTGIYYLSPGYDGFRAGRVTEIVRQKLAANGRVSFADMQKIQADTVMIDAEVFVPYILQAFDRASDATLLATLRANQDVAQAVDRFRQWDFSTPTGIPQGYDAVHSSSNDANSVAATIYAVWRSEFVRDVIDAKLTPYSLPVPDGNEALTGLRYMLDNFDTNQGLGASGLPFFAVPDVSDPADARDILILQSLAGALEKLAGPDFAPAFNNSTAQDDYRWGLLHRIVLAHPLDSIFSIPPADGAIAQPLGDVLPGFPVDGGFETVDVASNDVRASTYQGFMFSHGPSNRSVHQGDNWGMYGVSALPGGVSGVPRSPFYANLLFAWLNNQAYVLLQRQNDIEHDTMTVEKFVPAPAAVPRNLASKSPAAAPARAPARLSHPRPTRN
jgi:penicillin amidase